MPVGVEHKVKKVIEIEVPGLPKPLMPVGVEHSQKSCKVEGCESPAQTFDASRR